MKLQKLRVLWEYDQEEERFYETLLKGRTLHVCCGKSRMGDVRVDIRPQAPEVLNPLKISLSEVPLTVNFPFLGIRLFSKGTLLISFV